MPGVRMTPRHSGRIEHGGPLAKIGSSAAPGLPVVESRQDKQFADLAGEAAELRSAAVGRVLLGVE